MKNTFQKYLSIFLFLLSFFLPFQRLFADQSVSVLVPPHESDFQLAITNDSTGTIAQDQIVTYTVKYGSLLHYSDKIAIEAQWYPGTPGSIDPMDYVIGSAADAYNASSPIIDLVNHKIKWTITSFPASTTNQTVTFQLKTNSTYTGNTVITFSTHARLSATGVITSDKIANVNYQYDPNIVTPTPTPTNGPTATPTSTSSSGSSANTTPAPTAKPTTQQTPSSSSIPQLTPSPISTPPIQNLSIINLSDSNIQIAVNLNKVKLAKVIYGLNPTGLNSSSPLAVSGSDGAINLADLNANTTYYMQIITTSANGITTKSEVFTVQTAQTSVQPEISKVSLVIASDNDVLYSAGLNNQSSNPSDILNKIPQIPVSQNGKYTFAFKLTKSTKIKTVVMTIQNTSVLGVSNFHPISQPSAYSFPVDRNGNGGYSVQIKNPTVPGTYDIYIKITDFDGNISTQRIATIRVLRPFRVYNAVTKQPIEDARIVIYRQDDETKTFTLLPNFGGISNPLYTDSNGEVNESLPKGIYKANFGRIGYKGQDNVVFSIGTTTKDDFPTVYLKPTTITPLSIFIYFRNAFFDYSTITASYVLAIQQSYRFFDLIGLGVIFCFSVLSLLLFSIKSHIRFAHIPTFFHHHFLTLTGLGKSPYAQGKVIDSVSKLPISQVTVLLVDESTNKVIKQTATNKNGTFLLPINLTERYTLNIMKEGYEEKIHIGYTPNVIIKLDHGEKPFTHSPLKVAVELLGNSISLFFEFFLVATLILEVLLFPAFGILKTLPLLGLSCLNVLLWVFYLRETNKQLP